MYNFLLVPESLIIHFELNFPDLASAEGPETEEAL
jgi:hypothetical protein